MNSTSTEPFHLETSACRLAQKKWQEVPVRERLVPVHHLRRLFVSEADRLCAAVQQDINRPPDEVLATDLLPTAGAALFLLRRAARLLRPRRIPIWDRPLWLFGERSTIYRQPHGLVGIIGTWNYPIFLNMVQILQALAAGNGVVWKPSEQVPRTSAMMLDLLYRAGFPHDLIQCLPATREAGPLLAEAAIDHVVFTGSATVGRRLATRLGERLVSSTLELSGCDSFFVMKDANIDLAARAAWWGMTLNRGQTCLAVRRIFVDRSQYEPLLRALTSLVQDAAPCTLVLENQVRQARQLVAEACAAGAKLLGPTPEPGASSEIRPMIVYDATPEMAICREASFAPVAAVIPFDDVNVAVAQNQTCPYGLGASIFSSDPEAATRLATTLPAGAICINDVLAPAGHPATPFGGRHDSGWGVTQGAEGLLAMTLPRVISVRRGSYRPHYQALEKAPAVAGLTRGLLLLCHGTLRQRWHGLGQILRRAPSLLR